MSTVPGLLRVIRHIVEHKIDAQDLVRMMEDNNTELPPLAVTSLDRYDIQRMLGLTPVVDDEFNFVAPVPIPQDLKIWFEKSDRAHGNSFAKEVSIRSKLNLLLVSAHDLVSSSLDESMSPLAIQMERTWAYTPVKWKGKLWMLTGRPDYGIWYGEREEIELNVVVMEAKRTDYGSAGVAQALAYMGCVHRQRKELGKEDSTVYGISADEINFIFIKINNDSQWSAKHVGVTNNGYEEVLGIIVHLMRKASMMSSDSKRSSRRVQQGSGDSDLVFDYPWMTPRWMLNDFAAAFVLWPSFLHHVLHFR
ncbi:unnamed protein product [Penicillium olsonii]|nr:unnamed protein product [Penicillium olsonii]